MMFYRSSQFRWREGESIELLGELKFPGIYALKENETLLDVINRAGGPPIVPLPRVLFRGKTYAKKKMCKKRD